MATTKVTKCDKCGKVSENGNDFRRVIGNVWVPGKGGLIGNNIIDDPNHEFPESDNRELAFSTDDKSLRIYSNDYCVQCYLLLSDIECTSIRNLNR